MELGRRPTLPHSIDARWAILASLPHAKDATQHGIGPGNLGRADGDRPEPADLVLSRHRARAMGMGLARTPVIDQRQALVLFHLMDRSIADIAAETKANLNTVKSRLTRGRSALAALLGTNTATNAGGAHVHGA